MDNESQPATPTPKNHCCARITAQVTHHCPIHRDFYECPDQLVRYILRFDEYGIIIHDGGSSAITIEYCPWCGTQLPKSKRDLWFETLEAAGFDDPEDDVIPPAYLTDAWYR